MIRLLLAALVISCLSACRNKADRQVMEHLPINEEEYQAILDMVIPVDGAIEHNKLIRRNEISYYNLDSSTGADLYAEIAAKGPSSVCPNCSWAYHWNFVWKWDTDESSGQCSVKWINAKALFDYQLPLWVREHEAPAGLRQRYGAWMESMWTAINKRTWIVLREAALLERTVMALPRQDCGQLDRRIKSEGTLAIARINADTEQLAKDRDSTSREWMLDFR